MKVALAWINRDDPTDRAVALGLERGLLAAGHRVVIVGPRRPPAPLARWPLLADAWQALRLIRLQRRERFDLWHCHVFARSHRALRWAAALGRWKMLASLHLVLPDYLAAAGGERELRSLLSKAFHVTAVSHASLEQTRCLFPEIEKKSSVIYNGISLAEPEENFEEPLPASPYILCASRLAPYKGLDILLMALAQVRVWGHDVRLVLCGRDQMRGGLAQFARALKLEKEVVFAGSLSPARLRRFLDGCLFFALPSRRENFPLALLEAMAAGKPAVAASVGGVPEIVTHGGDGLLVPPGDVKALADAMASLCADAGLRERLGARARRRARAFDWGRAARDYAQRYAGR